MCDSLCHAGYSTPPSHTNAKMLCSGTETHEEEGACAHKLHVCSLQPLRSVGPCRDPQRKRCWCYPINLLSWDILAVRYGCLMLLITCEPSVCMRMQLTAWYRASWAIRWWWPYRQQNNQSNPILSSTRPLEPAYNQVMQPCNQLMRCLWHCSS